MSTLREHLKDFHKTAAEHHTGLAEHFGKLADHIGKAEVTDASHVKEALHGIAASHQAQAEYHAGACEECSKAVESELEKRGRELVPSAVSGVVPTNENFRRGITAVPRTGQPNPNANKPATVPEFSKAFSTDDELDADSRTAS
jgi:hypothetical protein